MLKKIQRMGTGYTTDQHQVVASRHVSAIGGFKGGQRAVPPRCQSRHFALCKI